MDSIPSVGILYVQFDSLCFNKFISVKGIGSTPPKKHANPKVGVSLKSHIEFGLKIPFFAEDVHCGIGYGRGERLYRDCETEHLKLPGVLFSIK